MSGCGGRSIGNSEGYKPEHYSFSAFIDASKSGKPDLLKKALDQNPSYLNMIKNSYQTTALVCAAANKNTSCLEILIAAGADLTFKHDGKTALGYAVSCECKKSIEILLKAGSSAEELSRRNIRQYADLIEKHCPELWEKEQIRLKFEPYTLVNEAIVMKREGEIKGLGRISTMFNFNAQTVTEIINDNPGTPQKFDPDNKDQIMMAHDFTVYKKVDTPSPFKKIQRVKI